MKCHLRSAGGLLAAGLLAGGLAVAQDDGVEGPERSLTEILADEPDLNEETKRALADLDRRVTEHDDLLSRFELSGDFRLRNEYNFKLDGAPDRNRVRVRFRLGTMFRISEELQVGARARTGDPDDPNSPYATLGDGFDSIDFSLDRAFVRYRPDWADAFTAEGGKFAHPFYYNPVYGEIVWDQDVQPEGAALRFRREGQETWKRFEFMVGEYILLERSADAEATITAAQVATRLGAGESSTVDFAASYYHYNDPTPGSAQSLIADNGGNALVGFDNDGDGLADTFDFRSRFGIVDLIAALNTELDELPLTFSGQYVVNVRARDGRGMGWAFGAAAGSRRRAGDWRGYYQFQVVEQDAIFSPVANDDFLLMTNQRGHVFGLNYQLADDVGVHLWSLVAQRIRDAGLQNDHYQWRIRLDLNISF